MKTKKILSIFGLFILAMFVTVVIAAPPATKYNPGETLDPTCSPGDANCSVDINASDAWLFNGNDIYNSNTGNVGIGVNPPFHKLDVNGNINISVGNTYKINNEDVVRVWSIGALGLGVGTGSSGLNNTFVGYYSGNNNTTGYQNTAIGSQSLGSNSTGYWNTAIGNSSLHFNSTGSANTTQGFGSLGFNNTGSNNTALGYQVLTNINGNNNVAVGSQAGVWRANGVAYLFTSNQSTFLGTNTKSLGGSSTNEIVIGYDTVGAGNNSVVLGNDNIIKTILKGNVGIGTTTPGEKLDVNGAMHLTPGSTPTNPDEGDIYMDSTSHKLRVYDGTLWHDLW